MNNSEKVTSRYGSIEVCRVPQAHVAPDLIRRKHGRVMESLSIDILRERVGPFHVGQEFGPRGRAGRRRARCKGITARSLPWPQAG